MAKNWYPVVDYLTCTKCGTCVSLCSHGVYDMVKSPLPAVINPESCVDNCHGCGNRCPVGAITYAGDDTGWIPPKGSLKSEDNCCSREVTGKRVLIEYLYLDLQTCDRCISTDNILDDILTVITPALKHAGYEVEYQKKCIETEDMAKQYKFFSSPTIRVNGQDVCATVMESDCGCCSQISGTDVDCRVFEYNGEIFQVPPKEMLCDAILNAVFGHKGNECSCGAYELSENLKRFFEGKKKQVVLVEVTVADG